MPGPDSSISAVASRLGIRERFRVALSEPPETFPGSLDALPTGAALVSLEAGNLDVIVCFSASQEGLDGRIATLKRLLSPSGALWVAWPRKTPGVPLTLIEEHVRTVGLAAGLLDTGISAIDESWTGLRFVLAPPR